MTAAHLTEFRAAVDAQQQRASLYSNGYATEEANYWTDAYGDGEKRLTLKAWMRAVARDSLENQREAWEARLAEEERTLPEACALGRQDLEAALAEQDVLSRAIMLSALLDDLQALAPVVAKVKRDALLALKAEHGATALAGMLGVSRQRVHQLTA